MRISIFAGDLGRARADALCTSTNPRLSLVMGTGASLRDRAGYAVLRECEAIVEAEKLRTGRELQPGSVHVTSAGSLPSKVAIHCVASDESHRSSADIIRDCATNALRAAESSGCRSIAMPVFGSGHASFDFEKALAIIVEALGEAPAALAEAVIVVPDLERAEMARRIIASAMPGADPSIELAPSEEDQPSSMWSDE